MAAQGWFEGISLNKSYASQQGLLAQAANKSHGQAGLIWMDGEKTGLNMFKHYVNSI
jgi:hypothetical protein